MKRNYLLGYGLSLAGAMAYGTSTVLIRTLLADFATPFTGATLAMLSGSVLLILMGGRHLPETFKNHKRSTVFLALSGIAAAVGVTSNYMALSREPVVVVAPITSINPLLTIVLAAIFLRGQETINRKLVLGALLVVMGVVLIGVGRNI